MPKSNYNCVVVIEQKQGNIIDQYMFRFDDYRVATALNNLLCNVNNVEVNHDIYSNKKGHKEHEA